MITRPVSHNYPLAHQLSSGTNRQPAVAHTNESSFASKICNIPCYSYKGTKGAVKYTYETITAHPIIAQSTLIAAEVVCVVLTDYHPFIVSASIISTVAHVAYVALTDYH